MMYAEAKKTLLVLVVLILMTGAASAAVDSVDLLPYGSNSDFYDGPVMNIHYTDDGATDKIDVSWTAQELSTETGENVETGLNIDVTQSNTKAVYGFRRAGMENIHKWETVKDYVDVGSLDSVATAEQKVLDSSKTDVCADLDGDGQTSRGDLIMEGGFNGFNWVQYFYCVKKGDKIGTVGEIDSNPRTVTSTTFRVENSEGKVETATISNSDKGDGVSQRIGPNTHVVFGGQDSAGLQPAVSTDELIMHSNGQSYYDVVEGGMVTVDQGWRVIDRNNYDDYKNSQSQIYSKLETWADRGENYRDQVVSGVNHQANLASKEHEDTEFSDATFNDKTSIEEGRMEVASDELAFAEHNIYVNVCENTNFEDCDAMAEIGKTTGVPEINDVSTEKFTELETGEVTVEYENVGESEGTFSARIQSCSEGFSFTGVSQRESLESGETHTTSFPVSFSTTSKEKMEFDGSCTVEVSETSTGESVTQDAAVSAEQVSECTVGEKFVQTRTFELGDGTLVERDTVLECVSKTGETEPAKTCDAGEEAKRTSDGYTCVTETSANDGTGDGVTEDDKCSFTLIGNPAGGDLTVPDPICLFTNAVSGVYGWFKLTASLAFGVMMYGLRVPIGGVARMDPSNTVRVFGTSMKTRWILGVVLGIAGFFLALNFLSGILGWISIGIVGLVGFYKLVTQGPIGLILWLLPDNER